MVGAARRIAGFVTIIAVAVTWAPAPPSYGDPLHTTAANRTVKDRLTVNITKVGPGVLRPDHRLVLRGAIANPTDLDWENVNAYLQITRTPVTSRTGLHDLAEIRDNPGAGKATLDDSTIANTVFTPGRFDQLGSIAPGTRTRFKLSIPYDELEVDGAPGVYRIGALIIAGPDDARVSVRDSTLLPLLPEHPARVQTLILLPISGPVKTMGDGVFADEALRTLLSPGGRLSNVLTWLASAPTDTVQVVVDPALLVAIADMADGYQVEAADPDQPATTGLGRVEAQSWLLRYQEVVARQRLMYLPWGVPAANSLAHNALPGPVRAAVEASEGYRRAHPAGTAVAGWLPNGSAGIRAVSLLKRAGVDLQIVSEASLPGLAAQARQGLPPPSQVTVTGRGRHITTLVTAARIAGYPTLTTTSPLQLRQRILADAAIRSMAQDTSSITVAALPFAWNPGRPPISESLRVAFPDRPVPTPTALRPIDAPSIVVPQSAIGALDRTGEPYVGPVRSNSVAFHALGPGVITAIRALRNSGGRLAAILSPSPPAERNYERLFALSGSAQWRVFPGIGSRLITERAASARSALDRVRITGPPFVAMSSDSGRFPLTVTNGMARPITVTIAVQPEDPALRIGRIEAITLQPGQRRDVQIVSTATGSGVTSVQARLATPSSLRQFGRPWRFDVRSTQLGLVIWIVMGVGGAILFGAAGYRIVNRIRGRDNPRQQASA